MNTPPSYQSQLSSLLTSSSSFTSSPLDADTIYSEFFFSLANQSSVTYEIETPVSTSISTSTAAPNSSSDKSHTVTVAQNQNLIDSTGGIIWETSYLLLQYLLLKISILGPNVTLQGFDISTHCDVGSGCGLLPIATQKAFNLDTTATEVGGEVLELLTSNCSNNGGSVSVSKLDWLSFHGGKEYDLVTGTDVLFREDLVVPLL
ncbi:hypothetical protein TrRE_jg11671, partial [Triparma retinervis]